MIKTHFFGKDCIIDQALINRENLALNLKNQQFIFQNILLLNQVHQKEVVVVDDKSKIYGESNLPKADGIVSNLKEVVLGIVTADCSPILLFDNEKKSHWCMSRWMAWSQGWSDFTNHQGNAKFRSKKYFCANWSDDSTKILRNFV